MDTLFNHKSSIYDPSFIEALLSGLQDMLLWVDPSGGFRFWNEVAIEELGYSPSGIEKITYFDLDESINRKEWGHFLLRIKSTSSLEEERYLRTADGTLIPVHLRYQNLEGDEDQGFLIIAQNISDRIRDREQIRIRDEQLRLFVQHSPMSIAMFDNKMRYIFATDSWRDKYNLKHQAILRESHYKLYPATTKRMRDFHKRCLAGEAIYCDEDVLIRNNGKMEWVRWSMVPWIRPNKEIGGIMVFMELITDHVKAHEIVAKQARKLEVSKRDLPQFALVASYDLREPLSSVTRYLEKRSKSIPDEPSSMKEKKLLSKALQGADRIQQLVEDMISYAAVGDLDSVSDDLNLEDVIKRVVEDLTNLIDSNNARVQVKELPRISANERQMYLIFRNLIENAIKYRRDEDPEIIVRAERQGDEWIFHVMDNGVGISPRYQDQLFTIFKRIKIKKRFQGTGIGLAICKQIAENHGGRIWVESLPGKGSVFSFSVNEKRYGI